MKTAELRAKTEDQLKEELLTLGKEQFNLRFQKSTGQLENPSRIRAVRRTIAKVKTLLAEKQSGQAPAKAAKPAKAKAAPKKKKETKE